MQRLGRGVDGEVFEWRDSWRAPTAVRSPRGAEEVIGEGLAEHEVFYLGLLLQTFGVGCGHLKPGAEIAKLICDRPWGRTDSRNAAIQSND